MGIGHWRLEFVREAAEQVARITQASRIAELRSVAPQSTTEGSLYVPKDYLTLPVLP